MGVDVAVGHIFLIQVLQQLDGDEVLEHVGVVTRVKGMAVREHKLVILIDSIRHYPSDRAGNQKKPAYRLHQSACMLAD
jgi:hypothetical protein